MDDISDKEFFTQYSENSIKSIGRKFFNRKTIKGDLNWLNINALTLLCKLIRTIKFNIFSVCENLYEV